MSADTVLSPRKAAILSSVVGEYIETGEPVASRTVSRRHASSLSAASIRNVMADLSEEGFLSQPHTSAGRVPTEKAFRFFVEAMGVPRPSRSAMERLSAKLRGAGGMEDGMVRCSHMLMELTHNVGIAAAVPASGQTLDQIELVPLSERRILVVVVTRDRLVRNSVVALDEDLSPADLGAIRNYLNYNFSGWTLAEARAELEHRLQLQSAYYDALMKRLNVLYSRGLLNIDLDPEVHLEGAAYLVGSDLHLTREKMRELLQALEQKKRILHILDCFLEQPGGEIRVQVGLGEVHPAMRGLSLIGLTVTTSAGMAARIAVLGPMRMDYGKVMAAVMNVGSAFQNLPS